MKNTLSILLFLTISLSAQEWSFCLVSDTHTGHHDFITALTEMKNRIVPSERTIPSSEFLVISGDLAPADTNYEIFQSVFPDSVLAPAFFPAIGNHDSKLSDYLHTITKKQKGNPLFYNDSCQSYFVDWKNTRIIVVDQYKVTGFKSGCINQTGINWIESLLRPADTIKHIFIVFHEPAFPRFRHIGDSFDNCPDERDQFWNMILKYKDKVRAVLVGHTHYYFAMKIRDPEGAVQNTETFPMEEGGIYQIAAGTTSDQYDKKITLTRFLINENKVKAQVLQADNGKNNWQIFDEYSLVIQ